MNSKLPYTVAIHTWEAKYDRPDMTAQIWPSKYERPYMTAQIWPPSYHDLLTIWGPIVNHHQWQ